MTDQAVMIVANRLGTDLLPDDKVWKNKFQIQSSSSDRLYTVSQKKSDGTWGCSCMGWKRHRTCKHLNTVVPMLTAAAAEAAAAKKPKTIAKGR